MLVTRLHHVHPKAVTHSPLLTLPVLRTAFSLYTATPCPPPSPAKECGLHSGNVKKDGSAEEQKKAERDLWIDGSAVQTLDKAAAEKLAGGARDKDTLLVLYAPWCQFCQVGATSSVCVCWVGGK
jgi:thiol:disulfide interchange protein